MFLAELFLLKAVICTVVDNHLLDSQNLNSLAAWSLAGTDLEHREYLIKRRLGLWTLDGLVCTGPIYLGDSFAHSRNQLALGVSPGSGS